jgi:hypothetical protein
MSISDHSREAQDENLLAAAVILRFYEEVDRQSARHRVSSSREANISLTNPQFQRWTKT